MKAAQSPLNASAFLVDGDKWRNLSGAASRKARFMARRSSSRSTLRPRMRTPPTLSLLDLFDDSARPGLVEARTDEANHQQLADLAGPVRRRSRGSGSRCHWMTATVATTTSRKAAATGNRRRNGGRAGSS